MTDTPKKLVVDVAAGTSQFIDLTPEEIADRDQLSTQIEVEKAERKAAEATKVALKESAKAKLVLGEPLTAEEAAVLVI